MDHFFGLTTNLKKKLKQRTAKKYVIDFALSETVDHINSFQVDFPSPHHLKTSGFSNVSRCLERVHRSEMGKP